MYNNLMKLCLLVSTVCASHIFEVNFIDCFMFHISQIFANSFNLLKTKRNLLYIRHQSVPRCKHFPTRLYKPVS